MRAFIALGGIKPVGEKLEGLGDIGLSRPDRLDRRAGRLRRRPRSSARCARTGSASPTTSSPSTPTRSPTRSSGWPASPRSCCASTARGSSTAQFQQKRLADNVADIYAQVAVLSRVTSIFEDQGVEPSGQERFIADTFCSRAAARVARQLRPDRVQRRRADDGDRQARLQARLLRLRAVRGLAGRPRPAAGLRTRPCPCPGPCRPGRSRRRLWSCSLPRAIPLARARRLLRLLGLARRRGVGLPDGLPLALASAVGVRLARRRAVLADRAPAPLLSVRPLDLARRVLDLLAAAALLLGVVAASLRRGASPWLSRRRPRRHRPRRPVPAVRPRRRDRRSRTPPSSGSEARFRPPRTGPRSRRGA